MLIPDLAHGMRRLAACVLVLTLAAACGAAPAWPALSAADFEYTGDQLDTSGGVVVLLREITSDESSGSSTILNHHVRLKILSEKGVTAIDKIDIPFTRGRAIRDLAARVVKSDGKILEVDPKSVHTREVIRAGKVTVSVKSFAFPGLEPGCIAEYRFRVRSSTPVEGMRLELDDRYPVALVRLRLRPFSLPPYQTRMIWSKEVNLTNKGRDKRGFNTFEATNIAPTVDEPYMPPSETSHPWLAYFLSYGDADVHWLFEGVQLSAIVREGIKPTKQLTKAAQSITAGATSSEEKIARLYEYCRTRIKNLSFETCGYTPEQIEDLKPNTSAMDVYTHGYGSNWEINLLFAALLRALGADCGLAFCNDRSRCLFDREVTMRSTLPDLLVALKVGETWRFYDPGALYLPMQKLKWRNENTKALVADQKWHRFIDTPVSPPEDSTTTRVARLRLGEDGTLDGEIEISHTGHAAMEARLLFDTKSATQRLELIAGELRERLPTAVATECTVHDVADLEKPLRVTYRVRVENYAEVTGDRLFVQPAFFQKGAPARFVSNTRKLAVYIDYHRHEHDDVTIDLPAGFERDVESLPQTLALDAKFSYVPRVSFSVDGCRATYIRKLSHELAWVAPGNYPTVKAIFDHVHAQDGYTITLRRAGPAAR